jgi:hypothetical protein
MTWYRIGPPTADSLVEVNRSALSDLFEKTRSAVRVRNNASGMVAYAVIEDDDRDGARMNAEYNAAMHALEQSSFSGDAYALALLFLCDRLIRSVAETNVKTAREVDAAGPDVRNARFGGVIRATINNGRHYHQRDWSAAQPVGQTKDNVDILEAAGVQPPWNRPVAYNVFQLMDFEDYEDFERRLSETLTALQ